GAFSAPMTLAIERIGDEPGTVLLVNLRVSRPDNWIGPHQTALTPAVVVDSANQRRRGAWPACEEAVHLGTEHLDRAPRLLWGQSLCATDPGTSQLPLPARRM